MCPASYRLRESAPCPHSAEELVRFRSGRHWAGWDLAGHDGYERSALVRVAFVGLLVEWDTERVVVADDEGVLG